MEKIKPLFCMLSPRDIPQVLDSLKQCPYDKLWIKYHPSYYAYQYARQMFLEHKEYTHLVIWTDDVVYDDEFFTILMMSAKDKAIVTGVGNVDTDGFSEFLTITHNLPTVNRDRRVYSWYHDSERYNTFRHSLIEVPHSGMIPAIIERNLVAALSFMGDQGYGINSHAQDVMMSNELHNMNQKLYANTMCKFLHLRHGGEIMVNKKPGQVWWEKDDKVC